jgi:glycosyltransferase involved in cell wall biosynthesis
LKVLWYNWRDILNPDAGGAEVFTHEVMKRLVAKGYDVTLFSSRFSGSKYNEIVDGVNIVRDGRKYSVYGKARSYYNAYGSKYDLVIDEINTRPFLTPKFVRDKSIIALFHQLASEFWFYETRFPLNYLGYYYLEKKWLSYYREIPTITISESSRKDLESLGFKRIHLVHQGLSVRPLKEIGKKEIAPTVVFVGRLKQAKMPHHAIEAFELIKKEISNAKMWVIGDGYMRSALEKFPVEDVTFFGRVADETKYNLISRAHLVLFPSVREGWGLVATESNAMGTPVLGYNVPGLRDSILNGVTGLLTNENNPQNLGKAAVALLKDEHMLQNLSANALQHSRKFDWDKTAREFEDVILSVCENA